MVFLHPVHNYALISYDPLALGAVGSSAVRAAELLPGRAGCSPYFSNFTFQFMCIVFMCVLVYYTMILLLYFIKMICYLFISNPFSRIRFVNLILHVLQQKVMIKDIS